MWASESTFYDISLRCVNTTPECLRSSGVSGSANARITSDEISDVTTPGPAASALMETTSELGRTLADTSSGDVNYFSGEFFRMTPLYSTILRLPTMIRPGHQTLIQVTPLLTRRVSLPRARYHQHHLLRQCLLHRLWRTRY